MTLRLRWAKGRYLNVPSSARLVQMETTNASLRCLAEGRPSPAGSSPRNHGSAHCPQMSFPAAKSTTVENSIRKTNHGFAHP